MQNAALMLMAEAFPRSDFYGIDFFDETIEKVRHKVSDGNISDAVFFKGMRLNYVITPIFRNHSIMSPLLTLSMTRQGLSRTSSVCTAY